MTIKDFLLMVLTAIPYGLGWCAGKAARPCRWLGRIVKWGWDDAHKPRQPRKPKNQTIAK